MKTLRETILKNSWQEDMVGPHFVRVDDAIDALRQWLADNWLVVVPREATSHMCTHASLVEVDDIELTPSEYRAAWQAMIAAAPDALATKP